MGFKNTIGVQLLHKQITHETHLGWNISKLAKAFVEVKVTGSGSSLLGEYEMLHHLKVTPMGKKKYEVKVNGETLVHLVPGKNQIEIITKLKDIPVLTIVITRKTLSIFENTIGIQLLYNKVTHKTLLAWNINKLVKAFVEVKVTGSGTALLGEYELFHHLNWNLIDTKNMDLMWNSKALITGLPYLNQIEIITQHEDIPTLTTIITWKTLSIFENTVGIQLLYNKVTHKTLL